jgi:hypothetical protein
MAQAWWIFSGDGTRLAGPYVDKAAAQFSLRVARTYGEVDPDAYIAKGDVSEDDWGGQ